MNKQTQLERNFLAAEKAIRSIAADKHIPIHDRIDRLRQLSKRCSVTAIELAYEDPKNTLRP
jgi:hypothetical protein